MAFAQSCSVLSQDHGNMGVLGHGFAEGLIDQYLTGGVVHMVVSPDHMGDSHGHIIGHDGHVISGTPI